MFDDLTAQVTAVYLTFFNSAFEPKLARSGDDARALLRQKDNTEVDLLPDLPTKTLTVRLHHLTQAAHDTALRHLCDQLNATETVFPETDLKFIYRVGASSEIPRDQEI